MPTEISPNTAMPITWTATTTVTFDQADAGPVDVPALMAAVEALQLQIADAITAAAVAPGRHCVASSVVGAVSEKSATIEQVADA